MFWWLLVGIDKGQEDSAPSCAHCRILFFGVLCDWIFTSEFASNHSSTVSLTSFIR
jgi:hypothetical protein